ncbi:MAG: branched-chain amino acid aminotransferase [Steroidobacteraceae bacterium]
MALPAAPTRTWTFHEDAWHEGNIALFGPRTHSAWLGSSVFDGARAFEGVTPDIERHCRRINNSALTMGLTPVTPVERWLELVKEGVSRFGARPELYIRPMYWAESGGPTSVDPDPASTRWCLTLYEAPMPKPTGFSITLSPFRRPTVDCMPVDAKAGCLYPNNARALVEAGKRGFDNCLLRDMIGNVAELATANIFMGKDEVVYTPVPNGTFLAGITRLRVIELLRGSKTQVIEKSLTYADFESADEIFSCGNYAKVSPVTRIDGRSLQSGPLYRKARELYWAFAHGRGEATVG